MGHPSPLRRPFVENAWTGKLGLNPTNQMSGISVDTDASRERHFATDHLLSDLKGRSVRGSAVTILAQGLKFVMQLGSTAILARTLVPADFGLIAMVTAVTGFIVLLKDAGLSMATVQRLEITHEQVSTLFWVNVGISLVLMLLTAGLAPVIAWLYSEPRLTGITLALAASFIFSGLSIQHQALMRRQMRFAVLSGIEILAIFGGIGVSVYMAFRGYGFWALVGMHVTIQAITASLTWLLCGWRPGRPRRDAEVRSMLAFGGNLTAGTFFNYCTRNLDNVLLGAVWGAGPLGLYAKAYQLLMLPISQINAPASAAALPALSRIQTDPDQFRQFYLTGISFLTFIGIPLVSFAFVTADEVINVFLGPGWDGAVTIFRVLTPAALIGTFNIATGWIFIPLGQADRHLKATLFGSILTIIAYVLGLPYGALGIASAFSLSMVFKAIPELTYAFRKSPINIVDFGKAIWRPSAAGLAASALCVVLRHLFLSYSSIFKLLIFFVVYTLLYIGIFWLLPGSLAFFKSMKHGCKLLNNANGSA